MVCKRRQAGFGVISVLLGASIVLVAALGLLSASVGTEKRSKVDTAISTALSIENRVLSILLSSENFSDPKLRVLMANGNLFPAMSLKDPAKTLSLSISKNPEQESQINPFTQAYTSEGTPCASFGPLSCPIQLEVNLILVDRPAGFGSPSEKPDWIKNLAKKYPIYGLAYRIQFSRELANLSNRGIQHSNKFRVADHSFQVPYDNYMLLDNSKSCAPGSVVAGIDPISKQPKCLALDSSCSKTALAKQLKASDASIYVECVAWKTFKCPKNYVVRNINPTNLDPDMNAGPSTWGSCVYFGQKSATKSVAGQNVRLSCGQAYNMMANCVPTNVVTTPCTYDNAGIIESVPANPGTAVLGGTGGTRTCVIAPPAQVCTAPYAGGTWTADALLSATCDLNISELAAMEGS